MRRGVKLFRARAALPRLRSTGYAASGGSPATGLVVKIVLLGVGRGARGLAAPPLIAGAPWLWLGVLVATTALIFYAYLSPRRHRRSSTSSPARCS